MNSAARGSQSLTDGEDFSIRSSRREPMKKFVALLAVVMLTVAAAAPSFAQQAQAPKGTEGPDIRKSKSKKKTSAATTPNRPEGPDVRAKVPPKGQEGPGIRKSEEKKAQ